MRVKNERGARVLRLTVSILVGALVAGPAQGQARVGDPAPASASAVLSAEQIASVVDTAALAAQERYVDATAGRRLAEHLRSRLAKGAYARLSSPIELGAAMTRDMREAVPDVHLRAVYEPNRAAPTRVQVQAPQGAPAGAAPRDLVRNDGRSDGEIARSNFGFERLERLDGNVGYLKLTRFVPLALSEATASAAMAFLGNSDALIIDLRGAPGGSPDLVVRLISYFVGDRPVRLFASYNRAADQTEELMSAAQVPGRRLTGRPLYVLQDANTASAAEMFGYIVQRQKLGQVVGAVSSGAGNGGNMTPLGSDMYFFLPQRRTLEGPGWEGVGVKPDVAVAPAAALSVAHVAALEALVAAASDARVRREREWALEMAKAARGADAYAAPLADFAGRFGARRFEAEGAGLALVSDNGARQILTRVGADVFRGERTRFAFGRDGAGKVDSVAAETLSTGVSRTPRDPA